MHRHGSHGPHGPAVLRPCLRLAAVVAGLIALLTGSATAASAHGADAAGVPADYRTSITQISPPVPGLSIKVVEGGSRLQVRWQGAGELQILGPQGEPYLRLSALGIENNIDSPESFRDNDRRGLTPVPPEADGLGLPRWQRLTDAETLIWHEHRAHWTDVKAPPSVQASPEQAQRVRDWTLPLLVNGTLAEVRGTLDYEPGPSPLPFVLAAVVVGALAVLALRTRWAGAAVCVAVVAADVLRVAGMTAIAADRPWVAAFDATGIAAVGWVLLLVAAAGLSRGRQGAVVIAAVGGVLVALTGALPSAGDLSASLPLTELNLLLHRATVAVGLGAGLGLMVGLIATFRRLSLPPSPGTPAAGMTASPTAGTTAGTQGTR